MSDTESLDYLQSGFDPSSLTVPRLRSILVSHNISYPASAKKPQLIEIFNDNVLPQSRKLLAARARAKRTSRGITDAESSQESTVADDGELMPPPPTPRPRSSRKPSSKHKIEDSESETPQKSPTKKTPRASSSKHIRASDTETGTDGDGAKKSVRRSRKSEPPQIKNEEDQQELPTPTPTKDSVFSYDNPFQSGSSPLSGVRSTSGESRRQTLGTSITKDSNRRKSGSTTRRRTDIPKSEDDIIPHTSRTFEMPISKLNGFVGVDDNGVAASEEFTPEEQMELVRERSVNGQSAIDPFRPKKKTSKRSKTTGPIWVVFMTLLAGYATWYRKEKFAVGYCGVGRESRQLNSAPICTPKWASSFSIPDMCTEVDIPNWLTTLVEPHCEPCPQHATCYEHLETVCDPDFVMHPHSMSLGGLIPLPPTCEPDGEKVRKVKVVADRAVEELRERRAKWECGDLVEDDGTPASSVEIDAEELKKEVSKKRRRGMSEAEFEDLWVGAIGEIQGRDEVEVVVDGYVHQSFIPSVLL